MAINNGSGSELEALAATQTPEIYSVGKGLDQIGTQATEAVAHKASSGFWNIAGSGFGKGALITAAMFVAGAALAVGSIAYADFVSYGSGTLVPGIPDALTLKLSPMSFAQGLWEGAKMGLVGLGNGFGLTALFAGGMVGAVADTRAQQNKLEAEIAEERSRTREAMRGIEQVRTTEVAPERQPQPEEIQPRFRDKFKPRCVDTMPEVSYCTRELDRRNETTPHSHGVV